jgi:hypothetical protein
MGCLHMNKTEQNQWKNDVLEFVLEAFARHEPLRSVLVFKGARILNMRLGDTPLRQSFDLDSNLNVQCADKYPLKADRLTFLKKQSEVALRKHISRQDPAHFKLNFVTVDVNPPNDPHPFNWDGYKVKINMADADRPAIKSPPNAEIDIASPETLGLDAVSDLELSNGLTVHAYTLERIAGEKMRAFLSSLPAYITKIGRRIDAIRVKDLYDIARIRRAREVKDNAFWKTAGHEFRLACGSRFIDCAGIQTFAENLDTTRQRYESDPTLPKDITFAEAWTTIQDILKLYEKLGIVPFEYPIPPSVPNI